MIYSKGRWFLFKHKFNFLFLTGLILLASGCGGGGGGGGESANVSPEAAFTASSAYGNPPLAVTFNGTGSSDSDGSISSYQWDFGDNRTGTGKTVQHTYQTIGTYTARLTVTDNDGSTGSATCEIDVGYSVMGTVTSTEDMVSDSDVNNPDAAYTSNNSFSLAQDISAPVTVSGFVNVDNSGSSGDRFAEDGDTDDYFYASLADDMIIELVMAESSLVSELGLYLYNSNRVLVGQANTNNNGLATLTVSGDGNYYIRVQAVESGWARTCTMYGLIVGLSESTTSVSQLSLEEDFVPGDVLVRFKADASGSVSPLSLDSRTADLGFTVKGGSNSRDRLLRPPEGGDEDALFERLGIRKAVAQSLGPGSMTDRTREKMKTLWMVRALKNTSGVECAAPNYIRKAFVVPDDDRYSDQWNFPLINLEEAWDTTTGSSSVIVAVVDTGVLLSHPDLDGQLVDYGYDFISDDDISGDDESGIDDDPDDPGDQDNLDGSSSFHGTHVAGIIAAASDNGTGVAGVAWGVKIMPLRALGIGGGTSYDIMEAVKYAAGMSNDSNTFPDNPADIINLSLGGSSYSATEEALFKEIHDDYDIIIIASAGNDDSNSKSYPAAYDGVVSVSAVTESKERAYYSSYGDTIDVAAPGGGSAASGTGSSNSVLSTCGNDSSGTIEMTYTEYMGTSMAAPHVAGVAALMKSLYGSLAPDDFDDLLEAGYLTQDLGDTGWDKYFGRGMIDAAQAVEVAKEANLNGGIPPILSARPYTLSFSGSQTTGEVVLSKGGDESKSLSVSSCASDESWLSVAADTVDGDGFGTYTVTVDSDGLSNGTYSGTLTFVSDRNDATVSVTLVVGSATESSDGGYHYIVLVDPDTRKTIDYVGCTGEDGVYDFRLTGDYLGQTYLIYAGTDSDNDGIVCGEAEACGAYLSLDNPVEVTVTQDLSGLDFTTDINLSLPDTSSASYPDFSIELERPDPDEASSGLKQISP